MAVALEDLSDSELDRLVVEKLGDKKNNQPDNLESLSDSDLDKMILEKQNIKSTGFIDRAGASLANAGMWGLENVAAPVGSAIDRFTGAPSRAAVGAIQHGQNPLTAFLGQIGQDPTLAPSGKQIAQRAGFSEKSLSDVLPDLYSETGDEWLKLKKGGIADPTASGAAGLGVDVLSDWSNVVPVGSVAKLAGKTALKSGELATKAGAGAIDIITGTRAATKSREAVARAGESIIKAVNSVTDPKISLNYSKAVDIAKKNGIDPELLSDAIKYGEHSFISRASRNLGEGPAGESRLLKHEAGLDQINKAIENKVINIAGGELPGDAREAGNIIRKGYNEAAEKFFSKMDVTYDKVQKYAPGLYVDREEMAGLASTLNGAEKYAKGLIKRGVTNTDKEQGRQILRAVTGVRATNGSFKQTVEALQMIGRAAFKTTNQMADIAPDIAKLREIYSKTKSALINTVDKHVGEDFAKELVQNNKEMTDFFGNKSLVSDFLGSKSVADENVFKRVFSDSKRANAIKNLVSPETFNQIKGAYLNSLIKRNADGSISFAKTIKSIHNSTPVMKQVFTPDEIIGVSEIVKLGQEYGPAIMSSSGTGGSNAFRDLLHGIKAGVVNEEVVRGLKMRAEKAAQPIAVTERSIPKKAMDIPNTAIGLSRSKTGKRLKALQVYSASQSEDTKKKRLKALEE